MRYGMATPSMPSVAMISLWRNDAERNLAERARHLVSKTYPGLRWIWVVGDSDDSTAEWLGDYATEMLYHEGRDVTVLWHDTGYRGSDHKTRLKRLSLSVNVGLEHIRSSDDYVLIHESDLQSPPDLVEQFLATGKPCIAATTWLESGGQDLFYDIWAFRANGTRFRNHPPYHEAYRDSELFEVDSVGSCWMFPAEPARQGLRCYDGATRELCTKLARRWGWGFWVAPWIKVRQPRGLWDSVQMSNAEMDTEYWQ